MVESSRQQSWKTIQRYAWFPTVAGLLVVWILVARYELIGKTLLASPSEVYHATIQALSEDATKQQRFHLHAIATFGRALKGWLLSAIFGIVIGVLVGSYRYFLNAVEPIVEFARTIPPVLALPLFLVAYSFGEKAYTATILFGCVPIMIVTIAKGVASIRKEPFDLLESHGVSTTIRLIARGFEVVPSIFLGLRLTLSFSLIIAVVSEMVFSPRSGWSLGALARDAEIDFNTPLFYCCVILAGIFGFVANLSLRYLEAWLLGHRDQRGV